MELSKRGIDLYLYTSAGGLRDMGFEILDTVFIQETT